MRTKNTALIDNGQVILHCHIQIHATLSKKKVILFLFFSMLFFNMSTSEAFQRSYMKEKGAVMRHWRPRHIQQRFLFSLITNSHTHTQQSRLVILSVPVIKHWYFILKQSCFSVACSTNPAKIMFFTNSLSLWVSSSKRWHPRNYCCFFLRLLS